MQCHSDMPPSTSCSVVVVGFSQPESLRRWSHDLGCPYPIYSDVECSVYDRFRMRTSVSAVWSPASIHYYAQRCLVSPLVPLPVRDPHEDVHQLAGDVLWRRTVAASWEPALVYVSAHARDRPSIDLLVRIMANSGNGPLCQGTN